jgi:hypothetical protein
MSRDSDRDSSSLLLERRSPYAPNLELARSLLTRLPTVGARGYRLNATIEKPWQHTVVQTPQPTSEIYHIYQCFGLIYTLPAPNSPTWVAWPVRLEQIKEISIIMDTTRLSRTPWRLTLHTVVKDSATHTRRRTPNLLCH